MRNNPDYYRQKDGSIIAYSQSVKPEGMLIFGYDYSKQKWITNGKEKIREYLKRGNIIKLINKEPKETEAIIEYYK